MNLASSQPPLQAQYLRVLSPMVDQNPGASLQTAAPPASTAPATRPWLRASPQCSTFWRLPAAGCLVHGEGYIADGEDSRRTCVHRRVGYDAASFHLQTCVLREPCAGRYAGGEQDGLAEDRGLARNSNLEALVCT